MFGRLPSNAGSSLIDEDAQEVYLKAKTDQDAANAAVEGPYQKVSDEWNNANEGVKEVAKSHARAVEKSDRIRNDYLEVHENLVKLRDEFNVAKQKALCRRYS